MASKTPKETKTFWDKFTAPFMVLKIEPFYCFWIVGYCISFAGIAIDLLNGKISSSIETGMIISTCMAFIPPLFLEFLLSYISSNRQKSKEEYSAYKAWSMAICLSCLVVLFIFYVTAVKSSWIIQLLCFFFILFISFYSYLVTKMQIHDTLLNDFKDKSYFEVEKDTITTMAGKSRKLKKTNLGEGVDIKL